MNNELKDELVEVIKEEEERKVIPVEEDSDELQPSKTFDTDIDENHIKTILNKKYDGINKEDIDIIKSLLIKMNIGEVINYNEFPDIIKKEIDKTVKSSVSFPISQKEINKIKTEVAVEVLEDIYYEIIDYRFDDVNKELRTNIDNMVSTEYTKTINKQHMEYRTGFLVTMVDLAKKEREKGNIEKAEQIEKYVESFVQSYNLTDMFNKYTSGKLKIKKIDIEKLDKLIKKIHNKYNNSKSNVQLKIKKISKLESILKKHFPEYDDKAIKGFIAVFCKYCEFMNPINNMSDHIFIYYTIENIHNLNIKFDDEESIKFFNILKNNINEFLHTIEKYI